MQDNQRKISFKNLLMYGVGDIYGGSSFFIIGTLFLFYMTDVIKLDPLWAGAVLIVGKIWDAVSDPLMGYISDVTQTRFGRRRAYFLIGLFTVGITFVLLWYPTDFTSQTGTFLYYTFAYVLFSTVFTMVMVPYSAINAEMTFDYKQRTRLSAARMIFSQFSVLISGVLPKMLINNAPTPAKGYLLMSIVFGILYTIPWLFVFFGTWELKLPENRPKPEVRLFFKNFFTVFMNKSFRIHILMYLFAYSAMDIIMALFNYYLTYYIGKENLYALCLGSLVGMQIISMPIYVWISNRKGAGTAYILGVGIWGAAMLMLFSVTPVTPVYLIVINCMFIGAGLSAGVMIPWASLPFIIDVDEIITGKSRAGVYSGMMTLIRKSVQALVLFLVGVALKMIGYVPDVTQAPETLHKLKIIFVISPVILIVIGIFLATKFKITPHSHSILMKELTRLKEGGRHEDVSPVAENVCEEITGIEHTKLYREENLA